MRRLVVAYAIFAFANNGAEADTFTSRLLAAPRATSPTGVEIIPMIQGGLTKQDTLADITAFIYGKVSASLPAFLTQAQLAAALKSYQPLLSYTPCSTAGCTMTGPLVAPLQAAGASSALDLGTREQQLGYLVTDFGAKCDGTTDDTKLIQAAMDAAVAVKAFLILAPRNMTCRANDLYYKTSARLGVQGTLKSFGNTTTPLSNYSSAFGGTIESDIVIEGDGVIDNQMTARGVAHPTACVYSYGPVQGFTLRGVTLEGCGNSPVNIVGGSNTPGAGAAHVYLSYVKILGTGNNNANQFANGCDDCWADHLRIDNLTNDFLWAFYGNVTNSGITHSYINAHGNPGTMGVGVLSDAGQPAPSANLLIEGNEIAGVDGCAVWVQGTSTATSGQTLKQKNIRIIGNDGHGNNTGRHPNWGGECILDGSTIVSQGNMWHDDGVANADGSTNTTPTAGIYFYPATSATQAVDHYTSTGDTIFNEGVNGTGLGVVIAGPVQNGVPASNYSFIGTRIFDNQSTRTMVQAFNGQCDSTCTIMGSQIDPGIPSPFGGLAISGGTSMTPPATIFGNGPYANYISGDVVIPGNSTNGGIGIFNGGLLATLPSACNGQKTGTIYDNGDHVARVCP